MSEEDKIIKSFTVHVPVELVKSDDSSKDDDSPDSWRIKGVASTQDKDLQGEEVDQEGLDISILKEGRGLFNNDHQKGPENILGQIDDADFVDHKGKKALLVEGYLFKHQPRAQAYYNIMKSIRKGAPSRVHFSIEGKVVERDMINSGKIKRARIDKVALTLDPVNPYTFVDLMKSMAASDYEQPQVQDSEMGKEEYPIASSPDTSMDPRSAEDMADKMRKQHKDLQEELFKAISKIIDKALSAGAGYADAPSTRTGGSALSKESLDSKMKNITYKKLKKDKKTQKYMLKSLIETVSDHYSDQDPVEIAKMICKSYELKLKELLNVD